MASNRRTSNCFIVQQKKEETAQLAAERASERPVLGCLPLRKSKNRSITYLNSCPEGQEGVAAVAHLEDAAEAVLCQVADLEDLQLWRHGAEVELCDEDIIDDYWRLGRLIEGGREQISGALVEVLVGREGRPVEVESHGAGVRVWQAQRSVVMAGGG